MSATEEIEDEQHGQGDAEEPQESPADFAFIVIALEVGFHGDV
ncbi:MAG: hypothetical protein JWO89_3222 [Verrucomicrobiaceae bacterium]|nr:hypothetical protein [Verrucomicrobiaceae bacterium]